MLDRVVQKALHEALQPLWESLYLRNSFGFRRGRGVWGMLAELEAAMDKHDCHTLVIEDVRKAFDNVRIAAALKAHRTAALSKSRGKEPLLSEDVLRLIETVLRGHQDREIGIDQGGCYSPDTLNLLLHIAHDLPLQAAGEVPAWARYADNLVYLVRDETVGHRVLNLVRRLLRRVGLSLKGSGGITDLETAENEPAQLLGFGLSRKGGRLRIELGRQSLNRLREHLVTAWETPDPTKAATTILRGWIGANGPAYESGVSVIHDVRQLASELGFREVPGTDELEGWWRESWERWRTCQRLARRRYRRRKGP
jgi:RNA-directed DNA polymerase